MPSIRDRQFDWKLATKFMHGYELVAQQPEDGTSKYRTGLGTGTPVLATHNSLSALGGIQIDTAGADATGDEIHWMMPVPYDMDIKHPLRIRVHWTSGSATAADDVAFVAIYTAIVPHSTTIVAAATALDTVIPSDLVTGAHKYQITGWGVLNGGTFVNGGAIIWEIRCSVADVNLATEYLRVLGVEFAYTPHLTAGSGQSTTRTTYDPGY